MSLRPALRRALSRAVSAGGPAAVVIIALTVPPSTAAGTVSVGLPVTTTTAVGPVSAGSATLQTDGVAPLPAPTGFGAATTGGAGGRLIHVTTAADSLIAPPVGSLRWAVQQPGAKWIVFDSDLTIALAGPVPVTSNTTIDGRGRRVVITGHGMTGLQIHDVTNVVIESLVLTDFGDPAMTSKNDPDDAISIVRSSRVWIDHCSLARAGDKLISAAGGAREITISANRFYEQQQTLQIGSMSTAVSDVDTTVTIARNHFDHVGYRLPAVSYGKAHVVNNLFDAWLVSGVRSERLAQTYLENNVFVAGTSSKATTVAPAQTCNDANSICDDRAGFLHDVGNLYVGQVRTQSTGPDQVFTPAAAYAYHAEPASQALADAVASQSGAVPTGIVATPLPVAPPPPPAVQAAPVGAATTSTATAAGSVRLRAKNDRAGRDLLVITGRGGVGPGAKVTVLRRTTTDAWKIVTSITLNSRGVAKLVLRDPSLKSSASFVVDVASDATTSPVRSNVVALR